MSKTIRRFLLSIALVFTVVCLGSFAAACKPSSGGGGGDKKETYTVSVTTEEDIDLTQITALWKSGSSNAGSSKLDSDGNASVELKSGSYTVSLANVPEDYIASPNSVTVSASKLNASFTIEKDPTSTTTHPVTVNITADTGVTLPDGLKVQIYSTSGAVGSPIAVSNGATIDVPTGLYTAKLVLPDYLTAADQNLNNFTTSLNFNVSLTEVDYTVSVTAPDSVLSAITVTFSDASGAVSDATDLALTGNSVTVPLLAGNYTVTLDVPDDYTATPSEFNVTFADRTATFTVTKKATSHSVSVTVDDQTGLDLDNLYVQLYNGTDTVGNAVPVVSGSATLVVPFGSGYSAKLVGLDSYDFVEVADQDITDSTANITFTVTLKEVSYTVTVNAPSDILDEIKVNFAGTDETDISLDGNSVTVTLLAGNYTVTLSVPEGYRVTPESRSVTAANRNVSFTVESEEEAPTTHSVTVTVVNETGLPLGNPTVQLYNGSTPEGSAEGLVGNETTLIVPLDGTYTAKLEGLPDYLQATDQEITVSTDDITFTVTVKNVDYTVTVDAPSAILGEITVTFEGTDKTDLSLTGNSVTVSLPAGSYTVTIDVPDGYAADSEELSLGYIAESRSATFTVTSTRHSVGVTINLPNGVDLPAGLAIQLYSGEEKVGSPVTVTSATTSFVAPNGDYKVVLENLPDYLTANEPVIDTDSDSVTFNLSLNEVDYTVTVDAPSEILGEIKVNFAGTDKTDLSLDGNSVTVTLLAGNYTVTLTLPDGYGADKESSALTYSDRDAQFEVVLKTHDVTVTVTSDGISLPDGVKVQLYKGADAVGSPVALSGGTATLSEVPFGNYTAKLIDLPDYLKAADVEITSTTDNATFTLEYADIEYTVTVSGAPLGTLVYFDGMYQTTVGLDGVAKNTLPAGTYTVTVELPENLADLYEIKTQVTITVSIENRTATIEVEQVAHRINVSLTNNTGYTLSYLEVELKAQLYSGANPVGEPVDLSEGSVTLTVPFGDYTLKLSGLDSCNYLTADSTEEAITSQTNSVSFSIDFVEVEYTVNVTAPDDIIGSLSVIINKKDGSEVKTINLSSGNTQVKFNLLAGVYTVTISGYNPTYYKLSSTTNEFGFKQDNRSLSFTLTADFEGILGVGNTGKLENAKLSTSLTKVILNDVEEGKYQLTATYVSSTSTVNSGEYLRVSTTGSKTYSDPSSNASTRSWTVNFSVTNEEYISLYFAFASGSIYVDITLAKIEVPKLEVGAAAVTVTVEGKQYDQGSIEVDLVNLSDGKNEYELVVTPVQGTTPKPNGPVLLGIDSEPNTAIGDGTFNITTKVVLYGVEKKLYIRFSSLSSDNPQVTLKLTKVESTGGGGGDVGGGDEDDTNKLTVGGSLTLSIKGNGSDGSSSTQVELSKVPAGKYKFRMTTTYNSWVEGDITVTPQGGSRVSTDMDGIKSGIEITIPANCNYITFYMPSCGMYDGIARNFTFYLDEAGGGNQGGGETDPDEPTPPAGETKTFEEVEVGPFYGPNTLDISSLTPGTYRVTFELDWWDDFMGCNIGVNLTGGANDNDPRANSGNSYTIELTISGETTLYLYSPVGFESLSYPVTITFVKIG